MLTLDSKICQKRFLNSIGVLQAITDRERAQIALTYRCASLTDVFWVRKKKAKKVLFSDINLYENHLDNTFIDIALRGNSIRFRTKNWQKICRQMVVSESMAANRKWISVIKRWW